jgi:hypothetical protein
MRAPIEHLALSWDNDALKPDPPNAKLQLSDGPAAAGGSEEQAGAPTTGDRTAVSRIGSCMRDPRTALMKA